VAFSVPETSGAVTGPTAPTSQLALVNITAATLGTPVLDVTGFTSIIVVLNTTNSTAGHVSAQPLWSDAAGNNIPGGNLSMLQFFGGSFSGLVCCYRNLGPFVSVGILAPGIAGPTSLAVYGVNTPPRFDGPYTPAASGQVLAFADAMATGTQLGLAPYAGPAFFEFGPGVTAAPVVLQYQDAAGAWHEFARIMDQSAAGMVAVPVAVWCPPAPCRVNNFSGGNAILAVIAA